MATHPSLRPETGVGRGPERFGSSVVDPERDQLRDELRRFEALADPNDEAQMKARAQRRGCRHGSPRQRVSSSRAPRAGLTRGNALHRR
jgi:hypothetical protein